MVIWTSFNTDSQFYLNFLFRKNFKLKLRHPLVLLMEVGMPCLFTVILAVIRVMITFDSFPNVTTYSSMPVETWLSIDSKYILYTPSTNLTDNVMAIFANTSRATPKGELEVFLFCHNCSYHLIVFHLLSGWLQRRRRTGCPLRERER